MKKTLISFVVLYLYTVHAGADPRSENNVLSSFIGEIDSIVTLAQLEANAIPGFSVNTFVNEMKTIRHSVETFIATGHPDQNDIVDIHGEYGVRLGEREVLQTLYKKVLTLEDHVLQAKTKADPKKHIDYDILVIELDIVEVGLEGVMRKAQGN